MEIKTVGVVGCGAMGSGITQVCARSGGYQVVVSEINDELLNKGLVSIDSFLTRGIERGKVTQEEKEATLSRIKGTTNMQDFSQCDLIIEAVLEDLDMKKKVFALLGKICPEHTILSSNSSTLSITSMASATTRQDKFLGLHFFIPAQLMRLLEIVRGVATSDETVEICRAFGKSIGKTPIVAKDTPGRIPTRLSNIFRMEAIRMVETGIGTAEDIDTAMTLGYNHPMGPLALTDLIGLDTSYDVAAGMYEETKDPKFAPPNLLKRMVAAGWLGRKTGKGFYEYKKE
ncbi:3-hydroxybutyryl-CoA dehydrogenase [subsurface metagenome]